MRNKDKKNNSTFQVFLKLINQSSISKYILILGLDRYVKKMSTLQLLILLLYGLFHQYKGLSDISSSLKNDLFSQELGLESISVS